jgi:ABC-2 type transport system ATP-binding protein
VSTAVLSRAAAGALASGLALALPAAASARDLLVRSFDGTPIIAHFFPAAGLQPGQRAPTVLLGAGWSRGGSTDPEGGTEILSKVGIRILRRSGYNTLTWDARGFGGSGDAVRFDSPHHEARDVHALVDEVARQPEAALDAPGDPRVGMAGASYGGGIQIVAAATDRRIDAIAPSVAWHSLVTSFYQDETLKSGWMVPVCGPGVLGAVLPGVTSPAGPQLGSLDPHIYDMCAAGVTSGVLSDDTVGWLASRGPGDELVRRVRAPTLLLHATSDTLIPLDEAIANHRILTASGVPTRMMWFCWGHGSCPTSDGPAGYAQAAVLRWFERWLKGNPAVDTGPPFEWLDQDGRWRRASLFPLPRAGDLVATGQGRLTFSAADSVLSGRAYAATPSPNAVSVDLPAPSGEADSVGAPELSLTYSGHASDSAVKVFAQIVDVGRRVVAGHQVTPVPLTLDGRERTVTRRLEVLAQHLTPASRYRLQLIGGTQLYHPQDSVGSVRFSRIAITLPLVRDRGRGLPLRRRRGGALSRARRLPGAPRVVRPHGRRSRAR